MNDRMSLAPGKMASGAFGIFPRRARLIGPPLKKILQTDAVRRPPKNPRPGNEQVGVHTRVVGRVGRAFGDGDISGFRDEAFELGVCDQMLVYPQAIHCRFVYRTLFGIKIV
jgi:hypothetical protein